MHVGARVHPLFLILVLSACSDGPQDASNPVFPDAIEAQTESALLVRSGNTPSLRLEQDNSSDLPAQIWDIAGNESGLFLRDVTNGSNTPFRIRPGARSSVIEISSESEVGINTSSPDATMHVVGTTLISDLDDDTSASAALHVKDTGSEGNAVVVQVEKTSGAPIIRYVGELRSWDTAGGNLYSVSAAGTGVVELTLSALGDLTIAGNLVTGGGGTCDPGPCDDTFSPSYKVETIDAHAAYMWKNKHLWGVGPTPEGAPLNLSKKTTGILHELEKAHIYIEQLHKRLEGKEQSIADLSDRLSRIEKMVAKGQR